MKQITINDIKSTSAYTVGNEVQRLRITSPGEIRRFDRLLKCVRKKGFDKIVSLPILSQNGYRLGIFIELCEIWRLVPKCTCDYPLIRTGENGVEYCGDCGKGLE